MAAAIDFRTGLDIADAAEAARRGAPTSTPRFAVIHGGRSDAGRRLRRMYLQRRVVAAVVGLIVLVVIVQLVGALGSSGAEGAAPAPITASVHRVESGDTLWSLATRAAPNDDPRDVVRRIIELNPDAGVSGGVVRVGQVLNLPQG